jgi:hypothetical protein
MTVSASGIPPMDCRKKAALVEIFFYARQAGWRHLLRAV